MGRCIFLTAAKSQGDQADPGLRALYLQERGPSRAGRGGREQSPAGAGRERRGLPQPGADYLGGLAARLLSQAAGEQALPGGELERADWLLRLPERRAVRGVDGRATTRRRESVAQQYEDIFGKGNFYLEIQDQGLEQEKQIHEALFRLERESEYSAWWRPMTRITCAARTRTRTM